MNFPLSPEAISYFIAPYGKLAHIIVENIAKNWPIVESALDRHEIYSPLTAVAAIATIAVETGTFCPCKEIGGAEYFTHLYEGRADLGNDQPGDGVKFCGRGFVQITGRWDYARFSVKTEHDLVSNPDLALDPVIAADILAVFFRERSIPVFAETQNWHMVRRRVNGGLTAWPRFIDAVEKLTLGLQTSPAGAGIPLEVQS